MKKIFPYVISVCLGAFLLWAWNQFAHMSYEKEGSLDIVSGAIIEFFMLQLLVKITSDRQFKRFEQKLDKHLKRIEKDEKKILNMKEGREHEH